MADHVPSVVHQRTGFQQHAGLRWKMVRRLKLVEKQNTQLANVLGVRLVFLQAAREAASSYQQLTRGNVVTVRLRPGKGLMGDFLDQSLAKADARNRKIPDIKVAAQRDERKSGDTQYVRAIAPDAVGLHALAHIALQKIGQAFAQQRKLERGKSMKAGTWCDIRERFRVATQSNRDLVAEVRARWQARFEKSAHVAADLFGLHRTDSTGNFQRGHQADGAYGQLRALLDGVIADDADLQAAAAEIGDATRRRFGPERGHDCYSAETRLFRRIDHFQSDAALLFDLAHERVAIASFARGAGRHSAITRHAKFIHDFVKVAERFYAFFEKIFAEAVAQKNAFAETKRVSFVDQRLDIERGIGPRDGEAHGIGARVDGGDMNRLGHFGIYRQRCASAAEGVYFVARIPSCSPMRWRSCLLTADTLASPSSSMNEWRLAMTSNSRLIIVW